MNFRWLKDITCSCLSLLELGLAMSKRVLDNKMYLSNTYSWSFMLRLVGKKHEYFWWCLLGLHKALFIEKKKKKFSFFYFIFIFVLRSIPPLFFFSFFFFFIGCHTSRVKPSLFVNLFLLKFR